MPLNQALQVIEVVKMKKLNHLNMSVIKFSMKMSSFRLLCFSSCDFLFVMKIIS